MNITSIQFCQVTTYVGKPSAAGQPTRPTFHPFGVDKLSSKLFIGCVPLV